MPIENSGIDDEAFRFALQAHFDFIVTDDDLNPLFAIEFDGQSHASETQRHRDMLKDELCDRFGLPILRINSRYVGQQYRQMDLLSWLANYWFAQNAITDAYESGQIPEYEHLDPMSFLTFPGSSQQFPMWLSAEVRVRFRKCSDEGQCIDPGPSSFVGVDSSGVQRAIAYMATSEEEGLLSETAMRAQRFNVPFAELLEAIVEHQLYDEFVKLKKGERIADSLERMCDRLGWYKANCDLSVSSKCSQVSRLREAL